MKALAFFVCLSIFPTMPHAQSTEIRIWPALTHGTQQRENTERWNEKMELFNLSQPRLVPFLPEKTHAIMPAVIVCPGGGYRYLCVEKEGTKIARWLNTNGVAAFVLLYRMNPADALRDARRAVSILRSEAGELNIDESNIGIMGFSAGAHLAANLVTHFQKSEITDPIDSLSSRPDYWIGVYGAYEPVPHVKGIDTTFAAFTPFYEIISKETPPAFLVHAADDPRAPVLHSIHLYEALQKHGIPAELHVYENGGHGFALEEDRGVAITSTVRGWSERCIEWMKVRGIISGE